MLIPLKSQPAYSQVISGEKPNNGDRKISYETVRKHDLCFSKRIEIWYLRERVILQKKMQMNEVFKIWR